MRSHYDPKELATVTIDLFRSGRRTVSHEDWIEKFGRRYDIDYANRVVDLVPVVAKILEDSDIPCVVVNEYCLRHHAESAVTTQAEARRCNVFNSGGKRPIGIRRAMPDDLVRAEVPGSQVHLNMGATKSAMQQTVNDVARGIVEPGAHQRLMATVQAEVPNILALEPDAIQGSLLPGIDDEG